MRRATMRLVAATVLLVPVIAAAAPGALVTPPENWRSDPEQAAAVAQKLTTQFGGAHVEPAAEVYVAPAPGLALIVTRATATAWAGSIDQAARAAVEDLHAGAKRAELTGGTASETSWQAKVDGKRIVATLGWRNGLTRYEARMVIATDGAKLVAVTGECYASDPQRNPIGDTDPAICRAALATLDTGIAAPITIGLADRAPEPAPPDHAQTSLTDGSKITLPPMTITQAPPEADRRPIYIGGGLIVLAAAFWWNRKRRDRFENEDRTEDRSDTDDEGLHAAARGDSEDVK